MKNLIIYYSKSGNTEIVAKTLSSQLSGDLIKITDYKERNNFKSKITSVIDAFRESKTKILPEKLDLTDYDLIYVGTPVWVANPVPAVITAIDTYNFKGKKIILFATMKTVGGNKAIQRMEEKFQARGGRVIKSFTIKTQQKNTSQITGDTLSVINTLNLESNSDTL
ncbi:MAG: flavodoxin domain-containing protein [Methanobrevibacter sp.]|jgi:flavodoxin|nr:flavodoxin domain-containing protein [Candidatus Methanovirga meridionalis]